MWASSGNTTKLMDSVLNELFDEFKSICDERDFQHKIASLLSAGDGSSRPGILGELYYMLDICNIPYEKGRDNRYYQDLVRSARIPSTSEIEDRMVYALFSRYRRFLTPEEYMREIVDDLETDDWRKDPLRVRILKQFIKYGNYLHDVYHTRILPDGSKKRVQDVGGRSAIRKYVESKLGRKPSDAEVLQVIDDGVFDLLKGASKEQKKLDGTYGLLKTVDDLATGKFRAEGATKKSLYYFAMVYGMTYYYGGDGQIYDEKTDINTKLFRDYYSNNLMRYITDVYKGNLNEYERDPSGQGINYKNFAEVIYIYYISNNYTAIEKLRYSSEMIDEIERAKYGRGKPSQYTSENSTVTFKSYFYDTDPNDDEVTALLDMPREEFDKFIREGYNCDTFLETYETAQGTADRRSGALQLETEQNTAYDIYKTVIDNLRDSKDGLKNCTYGLWFNDIASFGKKEFKNICDRDPRISRKEFGEFMNLLTAINDFLIFTDEKNDDGNDQSREKAGYRTNALRVKSKKDVTRTSIIAAYYYYFNSVHESDESGSHSAFETVFNEFRIGVNPLLKKAFYQPFSGKNIFDVVVAFSSYAFINN